MTLYSEPIVSHRACGEDTVTRFMARDEDGNAILDTDVESIDIVAQRRGEPEPFWIQRGVLPADLYQTTPQPWGADSIGYLWEHRMAWHQEDEEGDGYEPARGTTVTLYFFLRRAAPLGPVVVQHSATYGDEPAFVFDY